jgi:hypothetical protein
VSAEIIDWIAAYRERRGEVPPGLPIEDYLNYWGAITAAALNQPKPERLDRGAIAAAAHKAELARLAREEELQPAKEDARAT